MLLPGNDVAILYWANNPSNRLWFKSFCKILITKNSYSWYISLKGNRKPCCMHLFQMSSF